MNRRGLLAAFGVLPTLGFLPKRALAAAPAVPPVDPVEAQPGRYLRVRFDVEGINMRLQESDDQIHWRDSPQKVTLVS